MKASSLRQSAITHRRRGATAVEFAMVFPIAIMFFVGSIEFARANQVKNATAFSAYQGCRQAIIPGGTASAASASAQQVLNTNSISSSTIAVTPSTITDDTATITVTVSVSLNNVGWVTPFFTKGKTISRTCTLAREKTH